MFPKIEKLVVGAPFGSYFSFPHSTSTLGTFTWQYRGGHWKRLWRCLRTLRYSRKDKGWVSRLRLPNPGLRSLAGKDCTGKIISLHGLELGDWTQMSSWLLQDPEARKCAAVELNISCPNAAKVDLFGPQSAAFELLQSGIPVIAKLPPVGWESPAKVMHSCGVRAFHACNALHHERGSLSGVAVRPHALRCVKSLRQKWGESVFLVGGGGITELAQALEYITEGADSVAVASALINPFRWRIIKELAKELSTLNVED